MKFLGLIFFVVIFINLNLLKNKKIKNLCTIAIVFSLLVGCVSSSNESMIDKVSSEESNISSISEISSEDKSLENSEIAYKNSETTNDYNHYDGDPHIVEYVYIANGNSYYHKIYNCKYLEGATTEKVVLSDDLGKYECNCFTSPVEYKPSSNHHSGTNYSNSNHLSGQKVYIARGNSYYHKSASCKFIQGADLSCVSISDVGGKHPCNCIKY